jgi:hypothetical protein
MINTDNWFPHQYTGVVGLSISLADGSINIFYGGHLQEEMRVRVVQKLVDADELALESVDQAFQFGWTETSRKGDKVMSKFRPQNMGLEEAAKGIEALIFKEGFIVSTAKAPVL